MAVNDDLRADRSKMTAEFEASTLHWAIHLPRHLRRRVIAIGLALLGLTMVGQLGPAVARPDAGGEAFILTEDALVRADLASGRVLASIPASLLTTQKVVYAAPFVYLQRDVAVDVLHEGSLRRIHSVEFPEPVWDLAAARDLLVVAVGLEIRIFRVAASGMTTPVGSVPVTKPVHALTIRGSTVHALDNVIEPLYAHLIDVPGSGPPRVTSLMWEAASVGLMTQAIADRWYLLVKTGTRSGTGYEVAALPLRPPLRKLEEWNLASPVGEFRVHAGVLYGLARVGDDLWLVRRRLRPGEPDERAVALGRLTLSPSFRTGVMELAGSRLYVAGPASLLGFDLSSFGSMAPLVNVRTSSSIRSFALRLPRQ